MKNNLPKQVILLGWVSFFADVSSEMIYPLIPIFLVGVLGSPALALGFIEGIAQAIASLLSAFSGIRSDKSQKRVWFVRWGYGLPILGKTLISLAGSWYSVLVGRSIDRLGKGLRGSPRDALIVDAVGKERRGEAFGYHRMMDTAGAFVGVVIVAIVLWLLGTSDSEFGFRLVFGIAALLALCSLLVTFFVRESNSRLPGNAKNIKQTQSGLPSKFSIGGLGKEFWLTLAIFSLFTFANSSDAFLLLKASDVGLSTFQVVIVYGLYNLCYSLFSFPAGKLSDQYGRWKIITFGWIVYAVVYAGIALTSTSHTLWILFLCYGFYMALTEGVSKALIVDCVQKEKAGTALGIFYMTLGFSALTSNIIAGFLWDSVSKTAPFWLGSAMAIVSVFAVLLLGKLNSQKTS